MLLLSFAFSCSFVKQAGMSFATAILTAGDDNGRENLDNDHHYPLDKLKSGAQACQQQQKRKILKLPNAQCTTTTTGDILVVLKRI